MENRRLIALLRGSALVALLAACAPEPRSAPTSGDEVRDRAIAAQTAHRRTGAEIQDKAQDGAQDGAMNRVVRAVYLCDNSERLTVDFDNPRRMATVRTSNGEAIDLYQERAASGIWYRASNHDLRGKGDQAVWTVIDRDPTNCRAVD